MNFETVCSGHYRKRARRMRKLAADIQIEEDVRTELLELAKDYDRIALSAECTTEAIKRNL
jgi:hypothetical protein